MGSREDLGVLKAMVGSEPVFAQGLDDCNLLIAEPDELDDWADCPPRLGELFAHDGSEQEFCLLENGAVLLYSPLADDTYVVVGADLREFLGLLLHRNDSGVGGLAYDWEETAAELAGEGDEPEEPTPEEGQALARLTETFGLSPWREPRTRLRALASLLPPT